MQIIRGTPMKTLRIALGALLVSGAISPVCAADIKAGRLTATTVCAACHGANGVSVADNIPNLAGQKQKYLAAQLHAFKAGKRKNDLMNAIAAQIDDNVIANVTTYFASLPGASKSAEKSKPLDTLVSSHIRFPSDFKSGFTYYTSINFPDRKQVRRYYANKAAVTAARAGKPLPDGSILLVEVYKAKLGPDKMPVSGPDGFYVANTLAAFTAMERRAGWGRQIPEILRNGDWNYAIFKADKSLRPNVNQATCLACHKPLSDDSYVFTLKQLQAVARK